MSRCSKVIQHVFVRALLVSMQCVLGLVTLVIIDHNSKEKKLYSKYLINPYFTLFKKETPSKSRN